MRCILRVHGSGSGRPTSVPGILGHGLRPRAMDSVGIRGDVVVVAPCGPDMHHSSPGRSSSSRVSHRRLGNPPVRNPRGLGERGRVLVPGRGSLRWTPPTKRRSERGGHLLPNKGRARSWSCGSPSGLRRDSAVLATGLELRGVLSRWMVVVVLMMVVVVVMVSGVMVVMGGQRSAKSTDRSRWGRTRSILLTPKRRLERIGGIN